MIFPDLLSKLNNSGIGRIINDSKLGKGVEGLSEKYAPRPSDILAMPAFISAFLFDTVNGYCESFVDLFDERLIKKDGRLFFCSYAPNQEPRTLPFLNRKTAPVYELAGLVGGVAAACGCCASVLVTVTLKASLGKLENSLFGEPSSENIFRDIYAAFP